VSVKSSPATETYVDISAEFAKNVRITEISTKAPGRVYFL